MENAYIYLVFSSTPYRIGKVIRKLTGERYNHVSISLNESLEPMYGFARRHYHTPLYGGFVRESKARYCPKGMTTDICICRLPVTPEQLLQLELRLSQMYLKKDRYIYNHLSILGTPFRKSVKVKDSFTCVEFCVELLHDLGFGVTPEKYYTVGELHRIFHIHTIYTGIMPQGETADPDFFEKKSIPYCISATVRGFAQLLPRIGK